MPRENRKRGKKHKKKNEEDAYLPQEEHPSQREEQAAEAGPSWIVSPRDPAIDQNAPFGFVDPEVKAYFRTVDVQIREWQETKPEGNDIDEDVDPNEGVPLHPNVPWLFHNSVARSSTLLCCCTARNV